MSKTAILAGVSATLGVLLVDAVIKNRRLRKDNFKKEMEAEWYKLRYSVVTSECNYAYHMLDDVDKNHLTKLFNEHRRFLNIVEGRDPEYKVLEVY